MFIFYFGHMPLIDSKNLQFINTPNCGSKTAKYNFDNADDVADKRQTTTVSAVYGDLQGS